jgi:hypothetical protein
LTFPVIVGKGFTVMVEVREQPKLFLYVIVVVPAEIPVRRPVFEMVATEVLLDVHGLVVEAVPFPVNCKIASLQTDVPPVIVGSGFTVIVMVTVFAHCPALGVKVYVDVAVLFNAGDHVPLTPLFDVVGKEFNVPPEQMAETCVNEGATVLPTVIVEVCEHPLLFLYVIVVVPNALAVTRPELLIVATVVLLETHGFVVAAVGEPVS